MEFCSSDADGLCFVPHLSHLTLPPTWWEQSLTTTTEQGQKCVDTLAFFKKKNVYAKAIIMRLVSSLVAV